jgi:hypothetical protein
MRSRCGGWLGVAIAAAAFGCGEGKGADPITVTGTIVSFSGVPLAGIPVQLGDTEVLSVADGSFTFAAVSRPYDLHVGVTGGGLSSWYLGLTRADLVIRRSGVDHVSATVSGTISGADDTGIVNVFLCTKVTCSSWMTGDGPYSTSAWLDEPAGPFTGNLYALQPGPGGTWRYAAVEAVPLTPGETTTRDLVLADGVPTTTISGTLDVQGEGTAAILAQARSAGGTFPLAMLDDASPGPFTLQVPMLTGTELLVTGSKVISGQATGAFDSHVVTPGATGVTLAPAAFPIVSGPSGVPTPSSLLRWTAEVGEVASVRLSCAGPAGHVSETIVLTCDRLRLGDVLKPFPSGMTCDWSVTLFSDTSVEALAAPASLAPPGSFDPLRVRERPGTPFAIP